MSDPGRPLRIIHCFRSPQGGIFRHVRDLAKAHAKSGHEVGILCDEGFDESLFDTIRPFVSLGITRLPARWADIAALRGSYGDIRRLRPDVIHGHGAKGGVMARIVGSALRVNRYCVARLYSPHGGNLYHDRRTLSGKTVSAFERLMERLTDAVVFTCDFERGLYEEKVGLPRIPVKRIYNGISEHDFEKIHARPDAADFLFYGTLRDRKGPDVFIDAFARAERLAGRPLSALMVGEGPQKAEYEKMMVERGLGRRIEMVPAMKASDAFAFCRTVVVPSRDEAMPYIVLDALAARKPVIASNVGGIPEVLGENAPVLAPPGDAQALAAIMTSAVSEPGWAEAALPEPHRFKARFSSTAMANSLLQLYRQLHAANHLSQSGTQAP